MEKPKNPDTLGIDNPASRIKYQLAEAVVMTIAREARYHRSLAEFLPIVHRELNRVMDAQWFYLALYNKETRKYNFPYHVDKYDDLSPDEWISLPSTSLTDFVRRSDHACRITRQNRKKITRNDIPIGSPAEVWMGAPLKNADQESYGTICVQNYEDATTYDADDLNILEFAGIQIGMILESVDREKELIASRSQALTAAEQIRQLYHLSKQQQEVMASLLQGAKIILEYSDLRESSQLLFQKCKSLIKAECGFVAIVNRSLMVTDVVVMDSGQSTCDVDTSLPFLIRGLREEVLTLRQTVLDNDFKDSPTHNLLPGGHISMTNLMISPLEYKAEVIGMLAFANKAGGFVMEDVSIAEGYAELISLAWFNARNLDELKKARAKAEESDRLKSAFLSNMSHEIRTPLNGILGFSELLGESETDTEDRDNYIRIINQNGEQLISIINNILDVSMIESGQMTLAFDWARLRQIMDEVYDLFLSPGLRKPDVRYLQDCESGLDSCQIFTDAGRLKQILINLFGNATKFTQNGHVMLGCRMQKGTDGDEVVFFIEDTGPGIPSEYLGRIFERFRKVDDTLTRKVGGSGLGLAISKGLTELLGGRIEVFSTPKVGSTFRIVFPANAGRLRIG